jgi:hypothetical protein
VTPPRRNSSNAAGTATTPGHRAPSLRLITTGRREGARCHPGSHLQEVTGAARCEPTLCAISGSACARVVSGGGPEGASLDTPMYEVSSGSENQRSSLVSESDASSCGSPPLLAPFQQKLARRTPWSAGPAPVLLTATPRQAFASCHLRSTARWRPLPSPSAAAEGPSTPFNHSNQA